MTINLTDPANHPANGPLPVPRIERVIEVLKRSNDYQNGGDMAYVIADAIKGMEELLVSREAVPVAWMHDGEDGREYNGHNEFPYGGKGVPLYDSPPAPVVPDDSTCKYCGGSGVFRWQKSHDFMPCPCKGCTELAAPQEVK